MRVLLVAVLQCLSFSGLALAQCAPSDHVYIDPRLVIQRPHYTREQMMALMNNPILSEEEKAKLLSQYREQDQPIQMAMGNGYVLISSLNPCVQQFVPLRWSQVAPTMIDKRITDRCRARLIAVARSHKTITYSELATLLGVANQSVGRYLNAIYEEEIALGHPDLNVVVVYSKTGMGRFNSRGGPAQSIRVDPNRQSDVQAYKAELTRVYGHW
jgi:hypothetical protein